MLATRTGRETDILPALIARKADTAAVVRPLLEANQLAERKLAVESLLHSADPAIGLWLCAWDRQQRQARRPLGLPQRAVLKVLRRFPSAEAESVLLQGARWARCPSARRPSAVLAGGNRCRPDVLRALHAARHDAHADLRRAAEAALARLGERQALQWFRHQFAGEQTDPIHHAIQLAADEGVLLLWPELDRLADADDADVAYHACEALEQLREACTFSGSPL